MFFLLIIWIVVVDKWICYTYVLMVHETDYELKLIWDAYSLKCHLFWSILENTNPPPGDQLYNSPVTLTPYILSKLNITTSLENIFPPDHRNTIDLLIWKILANHLGNIRLFYKFLTVRCTNEYNWSYNLETIKY